jgi:hypothetical protein
LLTIIQNSLLAPPRATVASVEAEMKRLPHLASDRRKVTRSIRRDCRDARKAKDAAEAIGRIPTADEAIHLVISGRYALADMIPATLELAGVNIAELRICTLGFSRKNIEMIAAMVDAGQVGKVKLLCSHYFKSTTSDLYDLAASEFAARSEQASFLSCRTHAKLLLMELVDGRTVTVESSANARSCKNIEQACIIGDPAVYAFHRDWIDELFALENNGAGVAAGPGASGLRLDPNRGDRT